jgi:hypothetical protein
MGEEKNNKQIEKQKILLGLQQACKEVKEQEKGTLKEQTPDEFLDE